MRSTSSVLLLGLFSVCSVARPENLAPLDFAYTAEVTTAAIEGAHQLNLPLHVYQITRSRTLDDLRVFNAAGEVMPYALLRSESSGFETQVPTQSIPLFPLRGDLKQGVNAVRFSIRSNGTSVEVQGSKPGPRNDRLLGYLLDLRALNRPIAALTLHWEAAAADFSLMLNLEVSDDLVNWRSVGTGAIVNLHYNGQSFLQQRIDTGATLANYWRLSWAPDQPSVVLNAIEATPTASVAAAPRSLTTASASAVTGQSGEFRFRNDAHLPIDRLNLQLPELNSVAAASFYSRARATDSWQLVVQMNLYRLRSNTAADVANAAATIALNSDAEWRVILNPATAAGGAPLAVVTGWMPHTLQFLTRGAGPYKLAYGNATASSAAVPTTTLLAGLRRSDGSVPTLSAATLAAPVIAGGAARLQPPPPPLPWKTWLLWATLVLGAGLVGALAFRMLRESDSRT
jgi:hypothetical protein